MDCHDVVNGWMCCAFCRVEVTRLLKRGVMQSDVCGDVIGAMEVAVRCCVKWMDDRHSQRHTPSSSSHRYPSSSSFSARSKARNSSCLWFVSVGRYEWYDTCGIVYRTMHVPAACLLVQGEYKVLVLIGRPNTIRRLHWHGHQVAWHDAPLWKSFVGGSHKRRHAESDVVRWKAYVCCFDEHVAWKAGRVDVVVVGEDIVTTVLLL